MGGQVMLMCGQRNGAAAPVPFGQGLYIDANSLTNSRMWLPDWKASQFDVNFGPTATLFVDPTDGDCALINAASNSLPFGTMSHSFVVPAGCTEVTLEVQIKLPVGAPSGTVNCGIFTQGYTGYVNGLSMVLTPTGVLATHTLVYSGLTPGQTLHPIWNFNNPAQQPCLVKSIRVVPTMGDGLFGAPFERNALVPGVAIYDGQPEEMWSASYPTAENLHRASTNTRYPIMTDATSFVIEMFNDSVTFPQYVGTLVKIATGAPSLVSASAGRSLVSFTAPVGKKRVELGIPPLWKGTVPGTNTWPAALYVGAPAVLYNPGKLNSTAPIFLDIGDSAQCGFYGNPGESALAQVTDSGQFKFAMRACAGQSLHDTCATPLQTAAYVALFAAIDFDVLYISVSANDAFSNTFVPNSDYQVALADFVDQFHAAHPAKRVILQTALNWAASDNVVEPYRVMMANVQATRSAYVDLLQGPPLVPVGLLLDQFHPSPAGMDYWAVAETAALIALGY